jgi:hypothetical protein
MVVSLVTEAVPTKVALSTITTSSGSASCNITSFNVGTADKLIIAISSEGADAENPPTISSVSTSHCTGETAAIERAYQTGAFYQYAGIYYCDNPSGTYTISISFTNSQNGIVCAAVSFINVESGAESSDDYDEVSGTSITMSVTSPAANSLYFSVGSAHGGDDECSSNCWTPQSGQTEEWEDTSGAGGAGMGGCGGWEVVGSGAESHQWDYTDSGRLVGVGAVW